MLAAKAALACRADALFESLEANNKDKDVKFDPEWIEQRERMNKGELGLEGRTKVETRIRILEGGHSLQVPRQFESFILKSLLWYIDTFVSYVLTEKSSPKFKIIYLSYLELAIGWVKFRTGFSIHTYTWCKCVDSICLMVWNSFFQTRISN